MRFEIRYGASGKVQLAKSFAEVRRLVNQRAIRQARVVGRVSKDGSAYAEFWKRPLGRVYFHKYGW